MHRNAWGALLLLVCSASGSAQTLAPLTTRTEVKEPTRDVRADTAFRPSLAVYLDGNVKDAFGKSSGGSVVSGAIGLRYRGKGFLTSGQINVAAKTDTLAGQFGSALLVPGAGKAFNSGLVDIRTRPSLLWKNKCDTTASMFCRVGLHGYISASTTRWATALNGTDVTATSDVPVSGEGLGAYYSFFDGQIGEKANAPRAAMVADIGFAHRRIGGDLASASDVLRQLIGTGRRSFNGLELGLTLQLNQMRAGFTYYSMNGNVKGFSKGQIVAGVAVQASFLEDVFIDR